MIRQFCVKLTLLTSITLAAAQPSDIRQGLVAYWPLDSTDGATTPDSSPFGHNLTLINMDGSNFVPGRFGNAASFNGTDEILSKIYTVGADNGLPIINARRYTVMLWVKGVGATQGDRRVFAEASTSSTTPLFDIGTDSAAAATRTNVVDMYVRNDANTALRSHVKSQRMAFDGQWHHIAWVDDEGTARLYIDGVLDGTLFNYARAGVFTMNAVALGGIQRATTLSFFSGLIDDAAIWERPLSQAEIQQVMNNSLPTPVPVLPPYLRVEPVGGTRAFHDRITFRTEAVGYRPLSYQWLRNGTPIDGATTPSLTLSNLAPSDSDTYTVQVTNPGGTVTKDVVLTVLPDPAPDVRAGLVSYWPMDELTPTGDGVPDLYSHNDFQLRGSGFFDLTAGMFGNGLILNGTDQFGVRQGGFPSYKTSGYSVALWVKGNGVGQSDRRFFAESSTNSATPLIGFGTHSTGADGTVRVFIRNDANTAALARQSTRVALDGNWHHVVWTDTNGYGRLYIDGELDESDYAYATGPMTLDQTAIGAIMRLPAAVSFFSGALDDVAVWNRVLSYTEIQEIRSSGIPGPIGVIAPDITDQPVSQSVLTRSRVTFTFAASGTSPLEIQWRKGTTDLLNETNASLVFPSVTLGDAGEYTVVVANSAGRATSDVATLTVALRPEPPTDLRVDFNNTGEENAVTTEPGFESFAIAAPGAGPFKRTYGGADVTVSSTGVNIESRRRGAPVNNGGFTQERLLQDFIFARDTVLGEGMNIAVEFMEPNTVYNVAIWSFDTESATTRVSDWYANSVLVRQGYAMLNTDLPTSNEQKQIQFTATSDPSGKILIEGRRSAAATAAINVFINALQVSKRQLRIRKIEVLTFDVKLTIETLTPGAGVKVEEKTSLSDAQWTEVQNVSYSEVGSTMEAVFPMPDGTHFYHVVELP